MKRLILATVAAAALTCSPASAQRLRDRLAPPPAETVEAATDVLTDLTKIPDKGIPPALLADAHAVAVIPKVIKIGFVIAGRGGHGLVVAKDKAGQWGEPVFLNLGGGSVGFQVGADSTDVVLVFRDKKSVERLLDGKGKLTLGADVAIAAGPVGRQAAAGTDAKLQAEILSYSRTRGLFAGVALDGTVIRPDDHTNTTFRADLRPETAKQVAAFKTLLTTLSGPPAELTPGKVIRP